jgi:hypothetical protein
LQCPAERFTEGYRSKLDVDGVVEGQLALQILELLMVRALPCLQHVFYMEHPRLSAVRDDHHPQVWEPKSPTAG